MDFRQYIGKQILAWLWYDPDYHNPDYPEKDNTVCYVYPRVLLNKGAFELIDPEDFPKRGAIRVNIYGGESAEDVFARLGSFVSLKINHDAYPNKESNNMYTLKYNDKLGSVNSEIWMDSFRGKGVYQIIDVDSNITTLKNEKRITEPDCDLRTTLILIRCDDKLYGPFEYDIKEGYMILQGVKDFQYIVGEYNVAECNDELLVITDQNDNEAAIFVSKSAIASPCEAKIQFDWINQETLIDIFVKSVSSENGYTREQVRQLKEMVHQLVEQFSDVHFTEERIYRIQDMMESIIHNEEYVQKILQFALADDVTKEVLIDELVNKHFDQIQDRIVAFSDVQERLSDLKAQEMAIQRNIVELQLEVDNKKISEYNQDQIDELNNIISQLREENAKLTEKDEIQKDISDLKKEKEELEKERDIAKEKRDQQLLDNRELEKQFNATLEAFNDRAKQTARILDSKLLDKILRGVGEDSTVEKIISFDTELLHNSPMDYQEIIDRVADYIRNIAHRDVSINDVANYLICISQGFITTFAGEPGTGKTSLCTILAKALGLVVDTPQKRFIDISVERGWSSHKDFIGYYNPLTKSIEKSNVESYNAFEKLDRECSYDQGEIAPFIVLLDEANLSPLEHYWAAFLRNCDFTSVSSRTISLGGNNSFKLPEHLRFLATVNFDHTTEDLSPRYLDRSWVIMLEPSRIDEDADDNTENATDMISFKDMKEAFSVREGDIIDEVIQSKWNAIQKIFKEHSLQIMPRNLKMVKNFCSVACRCMERDTPATKFAPLDYAFSQKILPTINGTGDNYRMLIEDLTKECTTQNMPISAKHLARMKRVAENNMGFYQFFSH